MKNILEPDNDPEYPKQFTFCRLCHVWPIVAFSLNFSLTIPYANVYCSQLMFESEKYPTYLRDIRQITVQKWYNIVH